MKKMLSLLLVLSLMLGCSITYAEGMGVQIISGPASETEPVRMDDIKQGDTIDIPGFAIIEIIEVEFVDTIEKDKSWNSSWNEWRNVQYVSSGSTAEFLKIRIRILNKQKKNYDFKKAFGDVTCIFGDDYQFAGWSRQERKIADIDWTMYEGNDQTYEIAPLYDGYFDVVVTLPNFVVESKEPLSVSFTIGENEFTCNMRK